MIAHFKVTQAVQHVITGAIGFVYRVVPSPYVAEELVGVARVQVSVQIPSASGQTFQSFDYWLIEECIALPAAPIAAGSAVHLVDIYGTAETLTVIGVGFDDVCVLFEDALTGWVSLSHIVHDFSLTNSALAVA